MNARFTVSVTSWAEARAAAVPVREAVFVVEQGVPREIELDEWDDRCDHAVARDEHDSAIGTGRLLPDGHIGRMAVAREWRGAGVGGAILQALLDRAKSRGMTRVVLNAQVHAAPFYARFGFVTSPGEPFMEAGIAHVAMERDL
jgi:predicted GNAT family N-acyltransferase